ncbi:MAG: Na+/H+ antiporter subunit E [Ignavibacteriaceae bacterium]|nr:Na+/H+ antiporter subunit E [Ignavibacteriaceae bacterium]
MNKVFLNLALTVAWVFLTGEFTLTNFVEGFIVAVIVLIVSDYVVGQNLYIKKLPIFVMFVFFFIKELVVANLKVAYDILTPRNLMKPGIIKVPLDAKSDLELTILSNLITLTPGTLSLEISKDKEFLFVHCMYVTDEKEMISGIKNGFEKRLLEVLR